MTTFANVLRFAEGVVSVLTDDDDDIPTGHFGARTVYRGHSTTFLFRGEAEDPDAVVKGRIVLTDMQGLITALAYTRGGLAGGVCLGSTKDFKESFVKMATTPIPETP
jgi:hypothetical protein